METRKVAITGLGVVSSVGSTVDLFWENIRNGVSGIRRVEAVDLSTLSSQIGGEVRDFDVDAFVPKKEQRRMDRFSQYAIGASKMAVADSGLDIEAGNRERMGVIIGSGVGGLHTLEQQHSVLMTKGPGRCSPFMIPMMISNMAAGLVAIEFGFQGPNYAITSACASAAHSLGDALRQIQRGEADVMLAGGAEACVTELGFAGFCAMRALSTRNDEPEKASRPFDRDRDGFIMADGAAILVLEEMEHAKARGATIYAELAGYAATCDAHHITAPLEGGDGAARAMRLAMQDAGITPQDVDYINAHGTSTQLNDKMETKAIKAAFGEQAYKVMISSSKSMTGHLLGGAAGVESAVCSLALRDQVIPPTINHDNPDPECDLDYTPNTARETKVSVCLNNSLGFGGHNACLAFKRVS